MSEQTVTTGSVATVALTSASKKVTKDKSKIHAHALDALKFVQSEDGKTITLSVSRPIVVRVHQDSASQKYFCDYDGSVDFALSTNDSMQTERNDAAKYSIRNSLYQAVTRDLTDKTAKTASLKQSNAQLANENQIARAMTAVMRYALSMKDSTLPSDSDIQIALTANRDDTIETIDSAKTADRKKELRAIVAKLDAAQRAATDAAVAKLTDSAKTDSAK